MHFDDNHNKTASGSYIPDVPIWNLGRSRGCPTPLSLHLRISRHAVLFLLLVAFYTFIRRLLSSLSPSSAEETGVEGERGDPGLSSPQRVTISKTPSGMKAILRWDTERKEKTPPRLSRSHFQAAGGGNEQVGEGELWMEEEDEMVKK